MHNASSGVGRRHLVRTGLSGSVSLILLASLIGPAAALAAVGSQPAPQIDAITMDEDGTPATGNVLANDTDPDLDPLTVASYVGVTPSYGTLTVATNGDYVFTPAANWHGNVTTTYNVTDGTYTVVGYIMIHVNSVEDAPVAVDDESTAGQAGADVVIDVLANDSDGDGDPLEVSDVTAVTPDGAGTVVVGDGGADVVYTPSFSFTGEATFEYTVTDGGLTDTGLVTVTVMPDDTAPVMTDLATALGAGRVNETAPVLINWAGTDDATGIASYQVQARVGSGAWSTVYAGTATAATRSFAFRKTLEFRVRATDVAGNTGDWRSLTSKVKDFQEGSRAVTLNKRGWAPWTTSKHSGTAAMFTTTKGKAAKLTFTGRGVAYVAPRTSNGGKVKVYLDGVYQGRYDLSASRTKYGRSIFRMEMVSGTHTIKIVSSSSKRVSMDAFIVLR